MSGSTGGGDPLVTERVDSVESVGLASADLSRWFNPFLVHFARETLRCGGEVQLIREGGTLAGLTLLDPSENVRSIFTRSRPIAETLVWNRGSAAAYSDFRFDGPSEVFGIYTLRLEEGAPLHRFHQPVRRVTEEDLPAVLDLLREVQGGVDERWFRGLAGSPETGFVVQVGDRLAGVGWVALAGRHARLHSLAVRPAFHHLGLGADLVAARLLWARSAGAVEALSEIADRNAPSRAVAEAGGMRRGGEIFWYPPAGGPFRS